METRTVVEYEIFVPLPTEGDKSSLERVRARLVEFFGGMTDTRHRNEGVWKLGFVTVRDEIVIWKVLSDKGGAGDEFVRNVKEELEGLLGQELILVTRKRLDVLS